MADSSAEHVDVTGQKELSDLEIKQKIVDRHPFRNLRINDARVLDTIEGREICENCYKSRKFFCYTCCTPVIDRKYIPKVKLPIKIDIIKHEREIDGKSTAIHAAVLAPEDVKIYTYPDFPDIPPSENVVLIFPGKAATNVDGLFAKEIRGGDELLIERVKNQFPISRAIFIDSTWNQTKSIYKDRRLRDLRCVILKSRISQFWRHQKKSPRWYLSTIEAIHQFLVELHTSTFGEIEDYAESPGEIDASVTDLRREYCGQYDNLLYFFKYMYEKIHTIYDHDKLWAYKRPLI